LMALLNRTTADRQEFLPRFTPLTSTNGSLMWRALIPLFESTELYQGRYLQLMKGARESCRGSNARGLTGISPGQRHHLTEIQTTAAQCDIIYLLPLSSGWRFHECPRKVHAYLRNWNSVCAGVTLAARLWPFSRAAPQLWWRRWFLVTIANSLAFSQGAVTAAPSDHLEFWTIAAAAYCAALSSGPRRVIGTT